MSRVSSHLPAARLRRVERVTRIALGIIWLYQGLVPKFLGAVALEHDIVRRTGLWVISPATTMALVGLVEIGLGFWLLSGWRPRAACVTMAAFLLLLTVLVVVEEPSLLLGPFGGIVKNTMLFVAAWTVWFIAGTSRD